jgi:hypothetical protein
MSILIDKLTGNVYDFDIATTTNPVYAMKTSQTTIVNTSAESDISQGMSTPGGTILFPANYFQTNRLYSLTAKGYYFNNVAASNISLSILGYLNTVNFNTSINNSFGGPSSTQLQQWSYDVMFYFTSIGAAGQCIASHTSHRVHSDNNTGAQQLAMRGMGAQTTTLKSPFTINTTIAQTLKVTCIMNLANINAYTICNSIVVEEYKPI